MRPATMRPSTSVGPPAANGMIMVIERLGKSSAFAGTVTAKIVAASAARTLFFIGISSAAIVLHRRNDPVNPSVRRKPPPNPPPQAGEGRVGAEFIRAR